MSDIPTVKVGNKEMKSLGVGCSKNIVEDEWYPATLIDVSKGISTYKGVSKDVLNWIFEFDGDDYKYGPEQQYNSRSRYTTTILDSGYYGPKTNMYKLYVKITGKDLNETAEFNPEDLVGVKVDIMVTIREYTDKDGNPRRYANIDKIRKSKSEAQPVKEETKAEVKKEEPKSEVEEATVEVDDDFIGDV